MNPNKTSIINKKFGLAVIFLSLLGIGSTAVNALDQDNTQPIQVESDDAVRDGKKGLTTYRGNVIVTQGSLKLQADVVHLTTANGKLETVVALGKPARLEQKPKESDGLVKARASKITYNVRTQAAELKGSANLEQEGRVLDSDLITYDFRKKFVEAKSTAGSGKARVHVTIPPASEEKTVQ